jgi:hypothetical protein
MAKAKYHKSQRVLVKPVGTWAHVEAVVPKWVKGCEEPSERDWGGWCVPGAEYDLDPYRIEHQAELIVRRPALHEAA